jgi:predicted GTPase
MDINEEREKIHEQLTALTENVKDVFGSWVDRLKTPEIRERAEHFRDTELRKVELGIEQAKRVLDSPVHVGLLGKYSHGKSALVNALFGLAEDHSLPTGDGIVTAKVTSVEFNSKNVRPRCFGFERGGGKAEIPFDTFRSGVSGKLSGDSSVVDYYQLTLPVNMPFSRLFEQKQIRLIDLPGLGGPYFKDTEQTRSYVSNLDMLLVIIRISDIRSAARYVDPYLSSLKLPVIPVLTFFDQIQSANEFKGLTEEEAVDKARDIIKEEMPAVHRYATRIIAVSAKTSFQIETLRSLILNFVEEQNLAIQKVKREAAPLFQRKIQELQQKMDELIQGVDASFKKWDQLVAPILARSTRSGVERMDTYIKKDKDRIIQDIKRSVARSLRDVQDRLREKSSDLRYAGSWDRVNQMLKGIETDINGASLMELKKTVEADFSAFKEKVSDRSEKYIDGLELDSATKAELKDRMLDILEVTKLQLEDLSYKAPDTASFRVKMEARSTVDVVVENLKSPQFLVPLAVGVILIPISQSGWISWSTKLQGALLFIGIASILASIIGGFLMSSSIRKRRLLEAVNDVIDKVAGSFDRQEFETSLLAGVERAQIDLIHDLEESVSDVTNPYGSDVKMIREIRDRFLKGVEEFTKQITRAQERLEVHE